MMENTSFYINLAKQFTTEPDNIAMLAMTFYSRDFDIRNGNGNGNGKEIENEIEKLRTKMQIEQKECYYKRSLSVFSQR